MTQEVMKDLRISIVFETAAILPPGAPQSWDLPYFNLVVTGTTTLSPHALLKSLKEIEQIIGRDFKAPRWAPRLIDLDILAWGNKIISDDLLQIPHPELMNRPFLLELMASLQPDWRHPSLGSSTLAELLYNGSHIRESYKCFMPLPQMVGIVNITPDSFSDGGQYLQAEKAVQRIEELTREGAAIIDLGAQSTRPGAQIVSAKEEWERLEPVLDLLSHFTSAHISLDSFYPEVIQKALKKIPLAWVNDVQGGQNERLLQVVAETNCKIGLTHSLTVPASKTAIIPFSEDPMTIVCEWANKKLHQLQTFGISKNRIILDPGIGFGKTPYQSLQLLRKIDRLKTFGCEILVGHSRKSFLNVLTTSADRDLETLGVSHYLAENRVDYLRVHNVEAHQRCLTARAWVEGIKGDP